MSDILEQTETPSGGFDRRSALKKAAVAGAVAWTAPMVLSSRASAAGDGFCTPKCDPETTPVLLAGCAYCLDSNSKVPKLTLGVDGEGDCGACGGTATFGFSIASPFLFQKDEKGPSNYIGQLLVPGGNELIVSQANESTLGNGLYTSTSGALVVTSTCTDRNGDVVVLACSYGISFFYQPANGSCNQGNQVGKCTDDTGVFLSFDSYLQSCVRTCNGVSQQL
jgi:hypothetical protein